MARSRFRLMAGCAALALLAGCAGTATVAPDVDATGMPSAELALQRSVERVDTAMRGLGGMGRSARAVASLPAVGSSRNPIPAELQRPVTWAWSGPLDAGVKALADHVGYRLVVTASPGAAPVNVAVNMQDARILDLFEALGNAAGAQATVIVDPDHRQVEVRHHA